MRSARLKLYCIYLTNFDFVDKELQFKKNLVVIPKLNALVTRPKFDRFSSEKHIILKALILELLGNQKILMLKTDKIFSKELLFKVTLRRENLFLFLDSCLNTAFLHKHKFWVWDNIWVEDKLHFYLNNNLTNNFNVLPTRFRYSLQLPSSFVSLNKTNKDKFFYLIPVNKVRN